MYLSKFENVFVQTSSWEQVLGAEYSVERRGLEGQQRRQEAINLFAFVQILDHLLERCSWTGARNNEDVSGRVVSWVRSVNYYY